MAYRFVKRGAMASFALTESHCDYFVENTNGELSLTSKQTGEERQMRNIEPYLFEPGDELVGAEANVNGGSMKRRAVTYDGTMRLYRGKNVTNVNKIAKSRTITVLLIFFCIFVGEKKCSIGCKCDKDVTQ